MRLVWMVWLAGLLAVFALPSEAHASRAKFNKLMNDAKRHYDAGRYTQSAETLIEAYIYRPESQLIYNIARAYDQANELDKALEYYQRYVNSDETDNTLVKRSMLAMDRLRGLVAQRDEAQRREADEQARLAQEAENARLKAEEETLAKQRAEDALRARQASDQKARVQARSRNKVLALVAGGVAVAGLGSGTAFGLSANASKGRFGDAQTVTLKDDLRAQTRQRALFADVGFGVGVAAAVAAVLLYPKGPDPEPAAPRATLVPAIGGAGVEVRF